MFRRFFHPAAYVHGGTEDERGQRPAAMLTLVALSSTGFTGAAITPFQYRHTLRTRAARPVLGACKGPDEVVRAYAGPHEADADWVTTYDGPHEAAADWVTTYGGPREADADWVTTYEGPREAGADWTTQYKGVPVSSFHTLFDRCYEPAAPDCVRRSGSRPVPHLPCPPT